jgi:hypothetical protein
MRKSLQLISTILLLPISFQLSAQANKKAQVDTSIYSSQIVTIQGKKYTGFLTSNGFQLLNSKNQTYLTHQGSYFTWELKDFNKDGYEDIFLDKGGNTPERFDLLLYVPGTKSFRQVKGFENFPSPVKIGITKYYYSYHKSGCADANWDSDLFYISNFTAIRIGNISGRQCANSGSKDGLYINKFRNERKILFKTFNIDTINKYKDHKWGFIEEYWNKNYQLFL